MSITAGPLARQDQADATGPWRGFQGQAWREEIDTRAFLQDNYQPYEGDASFLAGATVRTTGVWSKVTALFPRERELGVYDVDATTPSTITAHSPGYIGRDAELIVGLQTDAPLKRAIMPFGGWRVVETSLTTYRYEVDPRLKEIFTKYRKTHNDGVFDAYTAEILAARRSHIVTGLPDAYGRGRIIGDYPPGRPARGGPPDRGQAPGQVLT
jgi:formate C-acetyltransferase